MKIAPLFFFVALFASAQTNPATRTNRLDAISNSPAGTTQTQTNQSVSFAQQVEEIRTDCIQHRRIICGKILKVLPDGLVVDSGYTNLMREPLNRSWLVPGTVVAARAARLIESSQPDSFCVGLVFLTDFPKSRGAKPKVFDYVNIEAFPVGQYIYPSVGDIHRTVRKFSAKLERAIQWKLDESEKQNTPLK